MELIDCVLNLFWAHSRYSINVCWIKYSEFHKHIEKRGSSVNSREEIGTPELLNRENGLYVEEMEFVTLSAFLDIELRK